MESILKDKIINTIDEEIVTITLEMKKYREEHKSQRRRIHYQEGLNIYYIRITNLKFIKKFFLGKYPLNYGEVFSNFKGLTEALAHSDKLTIEEKTSLFISICEYNHFSYTVAERIRILPQMSLEEPTELCKCTYQDILELNRIRDFNDILNSSETSNNPILQRIPALYNKYNNYYSNVILSLMRCANTLANYNFDINEIVNNDGIKEITAVLLSTSLLDHEFVLMMIDYLTSITKTSNRNSKKHQEISYLSPKFQVETGILEKKV